MLFHGGLKYLQARHVDCGCQSFLTDLKLRSPWRQNRKSNGNQKVEESVSFDLLKRYQDYVGSIGIALDKTGWF